MNKLLKSAQITLRNRLKSLPANTTTTTDRQSISLTFAIYDYCLSARFHIFGTSFIRVGFDVGFCDRNPIYKSRSLCTHPRQSRSLSDAHSHTFASERHKSQITHTHTFHKRTHITGAHTCSAYDPADDVHVSDTASPSEFNIIFPHVHRKEISFANHHSRCRRFCGKKDVF